ncbi:hypothetical protein [Cohnella sp.]|uniref:hypothetical protein n=1 Tax=Cohnella sp. TaxID=1883426 RepID=UPI0035699FCA
MGTRLLSEHIIKKYNPQLRYVRIHTSGKNAATLYAWNDQLTLPDKEKTALKHFVTGYLPPYVCYQIKEYSMLQADNIPQAHELPDPIVQTAMRNNLDQYGIVAVINGMFTSGEMTFNKYDSHSGTLHFDVRTTTFVTDIEKELILRYLGEIIPLGSTCKVAYKKC